jgi:alginate O-acetyltransferase complex protein AlgI
MVFSSIVFLTLFLPLFFCVYYLLPNKFKNYFILIASIFFYSWGAPKFIFAILGTTLLDYFLVQAMDKSEKIKRRKILLTISIIMNVGLLFYFKYCNFFIENINELLTTLHVKRMKSLDVILPIGISFYTFESLTYVIDVYRKEHKPLHNFMHYQLYIILFPKLIAGPIVRYHEIADQISDRFKNFTYNAALKGFHRFVLGLSKKVIIANSIGYYADKFHHIPITEIGPEYAWLGALSYTFQIYFDFSGYSDMAIGLGQMMGFKFPENFDNPYTSRSITEFWQKWHITLGKWMKNYLYIPMGGNRANSKVKVYFNLWIVFIISGFWHGASWAFIVWGIYHGFFLVLERTRFGMFFFKRDNFLSVLLTFFIVNIGWVIFRKETISEAFEYIKILFSFNKDTTIISFNHAELYSYLAVCFFFSFIFYSKKALSLQHHFYCTKLTSVKSVIFTLLSVCLLIICTSFITSASFNPFIYFRF